MRLSEKAKNTLMCAKFTKWGSRQLLVIERTLGWKTWFSNGEKWNRPDMGELFRAGLIDELITPSAPIVLVTDAGENIYRKLMGLETKQGIRNDTE